MGVPFFRWFTFPRCVSEKLKMVVVALLFLFFFMGSPKSRFPSLPPKPKGRASFWLAFDSKARCGSKIAPARSGLMELHYETMRTCALSCCDGTNLRVRLPLAAGLPLFGMFFWNLSSFETTRGRYPEPKLRRSRSDFTLGFEPF